MIHLNAYDKNKMIHSYHVVEDAMRLVREGKRSYFTQYMLNPALNYKDITFTLTMFLFICSLRLILSGAHHPRFRNLPSIFGYLTKHVAKPKKRSKLCENMWYACWHTFSFCFGVYTLYCEALTPEAPGWLRLLIREYNMKWYWFPTQAEYEAGNMGWPLFPMSQLFSVYYLTELAFWMSCGFFLLLETVRNDFYAFLVHHVVTCILIGFSYSCTLWRVGALILVTHDLADILLYITKSCYYCKFAGKITDILFGIFMIAFFLSRLVFFPFYCVRPALDSSNFEGIVDSYWQVPGGIALPFALCVLQMLHVFWFCLIVKMLIKTIKGTSVSEKGDIRSDSESSEDDIPLKRDDSTSSQEKSDISIDNLSSLPGVRPTHDKTIRKRIAKS